MLLPLLSASLTVPLFSSVSNDGAFTPRSMLLSISTSPKTRPNAERRNAARMPRRYDELHRSDVAEGRAPGVGAVRQLRRRHGDQHTPATPAPRRSRSMCRRRPHRPSPAPYGRMCLSAHLLWLIISVQDKPHECYHGPNRP